MDHSAVLRTTIALMVQDMTDEELITQRLVVLLDGQHEGRYGYEKIKPLLTEANATKMHSEAASAFLAVSGSRLGV